jgi:hypothetical protein
LGAIVDTLYPIGPKYNVEVPTFAHFTASQTIINEPFLHVCSFQTFALQYH